MPMTKPTSEQVTFLAAGSGASQRTVLDKLRDVVSVKDFGAVGNDAADDTAAIQAAINSVATSGGVVFFPPGIYRISSLLTLSDGITLQGSGAAELPSLLASPWQGTVIYQTGSNFAIQAAHNCHINDLSVWGSRTLQGATNSDGGVYWNGVIGRGTMTNVQVCGFTKQNAVAIRVHECYRLQFNYVFIYSAYTGLKTSGNTTTMEWNDGSVTRTNENNHDPNGRALDLSGSSSSNTSLYIRGVYFEACGGVNPIYMDQFGRVVFEDCGFEKNCLSAPSTTLANPIVINAVNPMEVDLISCTWSGWDPNYQSYSGTLTFLKCTQNGAAIKIDNCTFIQNDLLPGVTQVGIDTYGFTSTLCITNNLCGGVGYVSANEPLNFLLPRNATYPPRRFEFHGNRFSGLGVTKSEPCNVRSCFDVAPVGNDSAPSSAIPIAVTGVATTTVYTITVPRAIMRSGHGVKLRAWGRRTGTAGTKQAKLLITDTGAATSYNITGAVATADSWGADIVIYSRANTTQSVNVRNLDGSTATNVCAVPNKDFATYDMLLEIQFEVAGAADTMTLDGLLLEAF